MSVISVRADINFYVSNQYKICYLKLIESVRQSTSKNPNELKKKEKQYEIILLVGECDVWSIRTDNKVKVVKHGYGYRMESQRARQKSAWD